jgi:hypothetical protein
MLLLFRLALVLIVLAAAPPAIAAVDCRGATPLLDDLRIVPPAAEVSSAVARFAGAWSGAWLDAKGVEAQCSTLVVEEIHADGHARVVYAVGASPTLGSGTPNVWRTTARHADGVLQFHLPTIDRPLLAYRFDGGGLTGTFNRGGAIHMYRVPDVAPLRCGATPRPAPAPVAGQPRDRLPAADLAAGTVDVQPVHTGYFMPLGASGPARHTLRGTLSVPAAALGGENRGCAVVRRPTPAFTVEVVTHGDHLVPAVRDVLPPGRALILSPGRVWWEPGDGGMSRASLPFILVDRLNNAAHNGLATFLFDDTRVSALRVQIVQETALWARIDLWGQLPMTYTPGAVANEAALRAEFDEEQRRQAPMRPWSALPASAALDAFDGDAAPTDISANGLVIDGVLHVRGCHTRWGPFPYCREMRHGVFSVTKSAAGAVALLRLAQKYGDAVLDEKLVDHFPPGTVAHAGWDGVTFADALNMATGIGNEGRERDGSVAADENRPPMFRWVRGESAKQKLDLALAYAKYPWNRGEVLRYNSTHTFLLAVAMDRYLKRREGPQAHLWDMVRQEVLRPIGILHAPKMHTIEADGSRGIPLLGYGLYLTVDDVAKLVTLLQNGGRHDGIQILSPGLLAAALRRPSADVGLPNGARNRYGEGRYHLSFWSLPYRTAAGCAFQIPYMAGLGGNLVALLPNGVSVFRFADGNHYDLDAMVLAGESLRPFCPPPASATAPAPPPVPLTAQELAREVAGHTFTIGRQRLHFARGGRLLGAAGDDAIDAGTWTITAQGRVCRRWTTWDHGRERCYLVFRDGDDDWLFDIPERFSRFSGRRTPGSPEPPAR